MALYESDLYRFLQMGESMRRLTAEILEYRSIGKMFIDIQRNWSGKWFIELEPHLDPMEFDKYTYSNGGIFECLYEAALENRSINSGLISKTLIESASKFRSYN